MLDYIGDWADITGATPGDDYTLSHMTTGDLTGYTVLTMTTPVPTPGDTNRDYIVDDSDYDNLVARFGGPPDTESADFNGDGFVDLEDFATLRGYFGRGIPSSPETEFGAVTPEPATMGILALGGLLFVYKKHGLRR